LGEFRILCERLRFATKEIPKNDLNSVKKLLGDLGDKEGCVFFIWKFGEEGKHHVVLFNGIDWGDFRVMNPAPTNYFPADAKLSWDKLSDWQIILLKVVCL
jgi:hypothetical protein